MDKVRQEIRAKIREVKMFSEPCMSRQECRGESSPTASARLEQIAFRKGLSKFSLPSHSPALCPESVAL